MKGYRELATLAFFAVVICGFLFQPRYPTAPSREASQAATHSLDATDELCSPDYLRALPKGEKSASQKSRCFEAARQERRDQDTLSEAQYASNVASDALTVSENQGRSLWWQVVITAAAFVAASLAARAAFGAVDAANDTLEQARKASEIELRAYVNAVHIAFYPPLGDGGACYVQLEWKNAGKTPAKSCSSEVNLLVHDGNQLPPHFDFPDPANTPAVDRFTLGSGESGYSRMMLVHLVDVFKTRVNGPCIFAWGWFEYNDIFDDTPRRRTEFCYVGVGGKDKDGKDTIRWESYPRHSGMDNECLKRPRPRADNPSSGNRDL